MSVNLGSAYGEIILDTSKIGPAVKGAQQATSDFEQSLASMSQGAKEATLVFGGMAAAGTTLIGKLTMTAARTEELGVVVANMGRVHGKTQAEINATEESIKGLGITTQASRDMMIRLMGSELELADATKIARAAQDLAVISMEDSSSAAQELTYAIQSMQPRLLRKYGIYLNLVDVYEDAAKAQGVEADQLSESGKRLAWKNAVLEKAAGYAGTYEAAMTSAGKQLRSVTRYIEEASNELGQYFVPMLADAVGMVTGFLKGIIALPAPVKEGAATLLLMGTAFVGTASAISGVVLMIPKLITALTFLMAHPVVLAVAGIAALVAGLYALSQHLKKAEEAQAEQAREILKATSSYDSYVDRLDDAGLGNRALSKEIWEVVKAKLAAKDATEADKDAVIAWSVEAEKALDILKRHKEGYQEIAGVLPEYQYDVNAVTDAEAKRMEQLVLQDKALRKVAVAQGLLTEEQVKAQEELERLTAISEEHEARRLEAYAKAIKVDDLLTEEVKANIQDRVDAVVQEAEAIKEAQERIAETEADYELQRSRSAEDYADSRTQTIRDFQLREQDALESHQRDLAQAEEDHAARVLDIKADYAKKRTEKETEYLVTLGDLDLQYNKSREDAAEEHQAKLLELEVGYADRVKTMRADLLDTLKQAESDYMDWLADSEQDYQDRRADREQDYFDKLADHQQEYQDDITDLVSDYRSKIMQAEANGDTERLAQLRVALKERLTVLLRDNQQWLERAEQDNEQKAAIEERERQRGPFIHRERLGHRIDRDRGRHRELGVSAGPAA